jgi:predicted aspartyl protease
MVIDTGATVNFLSDRTARRLGLKMSALQNEEEKPLRAEYDGGSNARFSVIDRLEMGDLKLAKIPFLLVRGERMHAVAGEYVDGIIGLDLLKRFAARIDLSQHEMLLWLGGKLTAEELATVGADSQSIRLYVDKNRAEMVATINDEVRLKMLLDTGATKTVIQKDTSDALDLKSIGGVTRISTMYGPVETSQSRISTFTLGGVPIELPMIRFVLKGAPAKMPALLGLDVLSAQPILLDFPAERMYLLPAAK